MRNKLATFEKELEKCDIVVAVLGQPNVGKSSLFNTLTKGTARVGNFPGTTVEVKIGRTSYRDKTICFVDLPGIYGLSAATDEERIARNYIVRGRADVFMVLVDSTAPERTLYLAIQLLEMVPNVVIALTKWDLAHKHGVHIHLDRIESMLGVPVIGVSAMTGEGIRELLDTIIDVAEGRRRIRKEPLVIDYGILETYISEIEKKLREKSIVLPYPSRWVAIRLLEGDEELYEDLAKRGAQDLVDFVKCLREEVKKITGKYPEDHVVDARFRYASAIVSSTVVKVKIPPPIPPEIKKRISLHEIVEKTFSHPVVGPIASISTLFLVFLAAFVVNTGFPLNILFESVGATSIAEAIESYSLSGLISAGFDSLATAIHASLDSVNPVLASLLADGIVAGVGAVLSFFPLILIIAVIMSALEDSGLGPRMATALHDLFARFGLSGRAVYPLMIAMGCNVPAVLASRAAIDDAEKTEIAMTVSFIPCQARLIVLLYFVYTLFRSPVVQGLTVFFIYLGGIVLYLISSKILRLILFKSREAPPLLLEIPPLHKPNLKVIWWNSWDISKHFLKKAGLIIFTLSIIVWFLLSYGPQGYVEDVSMSFGAKLGGVLAPMLSTLYGFDVNTSWKIGFALINGFIAKEGLITAIAELSGVSEEQAIEALHIDLAQGVAVLLFMMYYVPCLATIAVVYQETRSIKITLITVLYLVLVSLFISLIVYEVLSTISKIGLTP